MIDNAIEKIIERICTEQFTFYEGNGNYCTEGLISPYRVKHYPNEIKQKLKDILEIELNEIKTENQILKAKCEMYEELISKSNFAPMLERSEEENV